MPYDGLPRAAVPSHYSLALFDLILEEPWTYQGVIAIHLNVKKSTKTVTVNTKELEIFGADLTVDGHVVAAERIDIDAAKQRCTFTFPHDLPMGLAEDVVLSISFEGTIGDDMVGFFRSASTVPDECKAEEQVVLCTQFQPSEARQAFPCFDEPNMKATFDFSIEVPNGLVALSNMPAKATEASTRTAGRRKVTFERTPAMNTYLLAWAVGDFEYLERFVPRQDGSEFSVRVYATKGLSQYGSDGLELSCKVVQYFARAFGIDYPLPKLDLFAIPSMADDGMENWGLITFQKTALLFDSKTSSPQNWERASYIIAHEIAHQWFGNLVTLDWWDDLWLNEGFAEWAGWYVIDRLYPEWKVWSRYVGESLQDALSLDGLHASHPIQAHVPDGLEVDSYFDSITYNKGSAMVRMLAALLGDDAFFRGLGDYFRKHAYGNTQADDLWDALGKAADRDILSFVKPWVQSVGYPIVSLNEEVSRPRHLNQRRFLLLDLAGANDTGVKWEIPAAVTLDSTTTSAPLVRNRDHTAFCRIEYSPEAISNPQALIDHLPPQERIGLIGDITAQAMTADTKVSATSLLDLLLSFSAEKDYHVWNAIFASIQRLQCVFAPDEQLMSSFNRFILDLTSTIAGRTEMCIQHYSGDNYLEQQLNVQIYLQRGLAGDPSVCGEVARRFKGVSPGAAPEILPSFREAVYRIAVHSQVPDAIEAMKEEYKNKSSIDGQMIVLRALCEVSNAELAQDLLRFGFSDDVDIEDLEEIAGALSQNPSTSVRRMFWAFLRQNWTSIRSRLGGAIIVVENVVQKALQTLTSLEDRQEAADFFANIDTSGFRQGLNVALERIEINARWLERDQVAVQQWLLNKGY